MLARVAAAAFVALAFGAPRPWLVGVAIVAAVELVSTLPLTPGNLGISSAAVAFVLPAYGRPGDVAVAAGLALALVETATSVALGLCGVAYLTRKAGAVRNRPLERVRGRRDARRGEEDRHRGKPDRQRRRLEGDGPPCVGAKPVFAPQPRREQRRARE